MDGSNDSKHVNNKRAAFGVKLGIASAEMSKCDQTAPNIMYTFIYCNKATGTLN